MTISSKQIRAARGLLNLSQKQLAEKSGLSINSLNNIERDAGSHRQESLTAIERALMKEGVEFLDKDGVRFSGEVLEIEKFDGPNILNNFYDEFLKAFPAGNGEVLTIGKDNRRFNHHEIDRLMAYKRFEDVAIKNNIKERSLFLENDTNFLSRRNNYRWVPRELFGEVPMAIYADNVAIILWGPPVRMVVIRNHGIAETFRHHFEVAWSVAKPVPDEVHKFHYQLKAQKILEQAKKSGLLKEAKAPPPEKAAKNKKKI